MNVWTKLFKAILVSCTLSVSLVYADCKRNLLEEGYRQLFEGSIDNAINTISSVIDKGDCNSKSVLSNALDQRGVAYMLKKEDDLALADLNLAIVTDKNNASALSNRASLHLQMKLFKKAIDDSTAAIKIDKNMSNAYIVRGMARIMYSDGKFVSTSEDMSAGFADLQMAYDLNPNDPNLLQIFMRLNIQPNVQKR